MMSRHRPARTLLACAGLAAVLLAGCANPPRPVALYRLIATPPVDAAPSSAPAAATTPVPWLLVLPVRVPGYLDRDVLWVADGNVGLKPLPGHRWAEPLRDAVPRLLRADLALLRGGGVWAAPAPEGVPLAQRLRVEVVALDPAPDGRSLVLQAQWSLTPTAPAPAAVPSSGPVMRELRLAVPLAGADPDALVAAHRLALWRLAQAIAAPD